VADYSRSEDTNFLAAPKGETVNIDDKVNHKEVQRIIEQALNHESSGLKTTERVYNAFRVLQERRRTKAPLDLNLAAAEHYMYARFLSGKTGDPAMIAVPTAYAIKKMAYFVLGKEKDMRTTPNNPVLPPSVESVVWGTIGVQEGLKDYRGENSSIGMKFGASLPDLKSEAYRNNK
jgi:hypothetical protein